MRPETSSGPGHLFHIGRVWGSRHGGSIYSQRLVDELRKKNWRVTLLAESFHDEERRDVILGNLTESATCATTVSCRGFSLCPSEGERAGVRGPSVCSPAQSPPGY